MCISPKLQNYWHSMVHFILLSLSDFVPIFIPDVDHLCFFFFFFFFFDLASLSRDFSAVAEFLLNGLGEFLSST